ncbi:hypothetical protein [Cellulomonas soli]|uniref:Uncharacterized protein n=1 Tax=Cellulomonas soli TaxID=931535 RepID=A0A512PDS6_9CELL|nr:hypothetical protein [Cellulomonas soli]NYI59143.1 hypothetical protein [Cellulomonas soli]GEP69365.1 hypothetical protein CSO01_20800 [Cellulomonas soli]
MTLPAGRYGWLPDHQLHLVATLAHADHLIELACEALRPIIRDGAVDLRDRYEGAYCLATVSAVKPIPPAVSRYTADALTQLRAAVEHVLYAEVEHTLGRDLTDREEKVVETPAFTDADNLTRWFNDSRRKTIGPLQDGTRLAKRVRELQPYNLRKTPDQHPLRLLAEHTNHAKHRAPVIAATRIGTVIPDWMPPGVEIPAQAERPVEVGDVLAISPRGVVLPMDIWPTISIRRPHTGQYPVLAHELDLIADWVRTVAIPILIAGTRDVAPLPVQLDTSAPWADVRDALADGGHMTAAARFRRSIQVAIARDNLAFVMDSHPEQPGRSDVRRWVAALSDEEVLERATSIGGVVSVDDAVYAKSVTDRWVDEIRAVATP